MKPLKLAKLYIVEYYEHNICKSTSLLWLYSYISKVLSLPLENCPVQVSKAVQNHPPHSSKSKPRIVNIAKSFLQPSTPLITVKNPTPHNGLSPSNNHLL